MPLEGQKEEKAPAIENKENKENPINKIKIPEYKPGASTISFEEKKQQEQDQKDIQALEDQLGISDGQQENNNNQERRVSKDSMGNTFEVAKGQDILNSLYKIQDGIKGITDPKAVESYIKSNFSSTEIKNMQLFLQTGNYYNTVEQRLAKVDGLFQGGTFEAFENRTKGIQNKEKMGTLKGFDGSFNRFANDVFYTDGDVKGSYMTGENTTLNTNYPAFKKGVDTQLNDFYRDYPQAERNINKITIQVAPKVPVIKNIDDLFTYAPMMGFENNEYMNNYVNTLSQAAKKTGTDFKSQYDPGSYRIYKDNNNKVSEFVTKNNLTIGGEGNQQIQSIQKAIDTVNLKLISEGFFEKATQKLESLAMDRSEILWKQITKDLGKDTKITPNVLPPQRIDPKDNRDACNGFDVVFGLENKLNS